MSSSNYVGSTMLQQGDVVSPEMVHRSVGISSTDSIKVAVRVRPLNSKEVAANVSEGVTVAEVRIVVYCPGSRAATEHSLTKGGHM